MKHTNEIRLNYAQKNRNIFIFCVYYSIFIKPVEKQLINKEVLILKRAILQNNILNICGANQRPHKLKFKNNFKIIFKLF